MSNLNNTSTKELLDRARQQLASGREALDFSDNVAPDRLLDLFEILIELAARDHNRRH